MQRKDYKKLPETPGVYFMKDADGKLLYVGKAGNLRRRVSSYFERPHDIRIERLVSHIAEIDFEETDSALEALIREAELIKLLEPPFNIREKDGKSFLYVEITKEKFPRVLLVRAASFAKPTASQSKDFEKRTHFGPFVSASSARAAMKILRRIFPWNTHPMETIGTFKRPCFDAQVGLCPGTCIGTIDQKEYTKTIDRLKLFMAGKKKRVIQSMEKDMIAAGKKLEFEKAAKLRGQIFALQHIHDTALIGENEIAEGREPMANNFRIEGYDISNISGTSPVGSMVVFEDGEPNVNEYRKFKIKTVEGPNDVAMLTEVLERRFKKHGIETSQHSMANGAPSTQLATDYWQLPDLILIDGGLPQVNAAYRTLRRLRIKIPILGLAKGPERKRNDVIGTMPKNVTLETLIKVRDEAHRFAIRYHKSVRKRQFFK
jgi:excinuclease ABC subunit C